MTARPGWGEEWACEYCGQQGELPAGETVDTFQCPDCGEPVVPM